ncbi:hypothetical protein NMY3_02673 [Candidatus Nitrosocosmicus oleophilus]|uniref:Uncharacterized protein n=1 Tax=Candidatus Nitrosocosmicus oleophilus TaxID=1353260 RepID=A0A654M2P1_9ARCH|nr:hypothetical protein [Candidatus Nitrosocosmicus oleophilus]ALI36863.1 hypothetical protein NMY3_02673 [Candidatus Nitrosocosmicus oleophilus]
MQNIVTQTSQAESILKPINRVYESIDLPFLEIFGIEKGTNLYSHTVTFPTIDICPVDSDTILFKLDKNSLTLCRLENRSTMENRFCYIIKTELTSFGYESKESLNWEVLFYGHHGGLHGLHHNTVNSYIINNDDTRKGFYVKCEHKNKILTALINLDNCDWYDEWLWNTKTVWEFKSGNLVICKAS